MGSNHILNDLFVDVFWSSVCKYIRHILDKKKKSTTYKYLATMGTELDDRSYYWFSWTIYIPGYLSFTPDKQDNVCLLYNRGKATYI